MKEARRRLLVAWRALCGWSVVDGVTVDDGNVEILRQHCHISEGSHLHHCLIKTQGPGAVVLISGRPGVNTGHYAVARNMREARWIARHGKPQ